jgi:HTH-type transcriptional regulator/antitoxin HigA
MSAQLVLKPIFDAWDSFHEASHVGHIANTNDYDEAIKVADALVDEGAMEGDHPQHSLFMMLADLIHAYDQRNFPIPHVSGNQMLRFLMDQHGLKQTQLPEIGKQSVVSEILSGKRELTVSHIAGLSKRFAVSPAAFFSN